MLRAVKLSHVLIMKGLESLDQTILPRHVLGELLKFIPTDEELGSCKLYERDADHLAPAEKFLYHVSKIYKYGEKLKVAQESKRMSRPCILSHLGKKCRMMQRT